MIMHTWALSNTTKRKDRNQQGIKLISNEEFHFATNVAEHFH